MKSNLPSKTESNLPTIHTAMKGYNTLDSMLEDAEKLIKGGMVPFAKASDVVLVMQTALDLHMSIPFALANLYPVQGRISAGVHLLAAILAKGKVRIEVIEDFVDIYLIARKGGIKTTKTGDFIENNNLKVCSLKDYNEMSKLYGEDIYVKFPPIAGLNDSFQDKRTTIRMFRSDTNTTVERSYCLHEAFQAGYFAEGKEKDNWIAHTKSMLWARAFSRTAKVIGSDLLFGMSEFSELADTFDIPYTIDEAGNARPSNETIHDPYDEL